MDLLSNHKVEKEEEHLADLEEVIVDAKTSAAIAILQAKINLAEDLENASSWDVEGRREVLAKLIDKSIVANQDPMLMFTGGGEKKVTTDDDQNKI